MNYRNNPNDNPDYQGQPENEDYDSAVHRDLASSRDLFETEQAKRFQTAVAKHQSPDGARDRQERGLREQLPGNAPARCAQRKTHGQLLPAGEAASHHQVGDIHRTNEKQEEDASPK